jgi:hypothetical protein
MHRGMTTIWTGKSQPQPGEALCDEPWTRSQLLQQFPALSEQFTDAFLFRTPF